MPSCGRAGVAPACPPQSPPRRALIRKTWFEARALGFEAEAKENLTLDEVEKFTADGKPMIAVGQFWRTGSPTAVAEVSYTADVNGRRSKNQS
jgi:hypothetical protein